MFNYRIYIGIPLFRFKRIKRVVHVIGFFIGVKSRVCLSTGVVRSGCCEEELNFCICAGATAVCLFMPIVQLGPGDI